MTPPTTLIQNAPICEMQMSRLWEAAWLTHRLDELPEVRTDLVERVRNEIDAGAYVTVDEYEAILDKIVDDVADDLV